MNLDVVKGKTLLIVDDEPDLRGPLVMEFESLGCKVFEAGSGHEALEIVKREKIDAVISDIRMPDGDGVELLRNIKELHHAVPVVMLITGFSDLSREEAYHLGAEAILAKPFDLDEIDRAVSRILTPREERWAAEVDAGKIKRTLSEKYSDLQEALAGGRLGLGRGGIFVQLLADQPATGQLVGLKIQFSSGELLLLEGAGVVRWVRREEADGLPKGCGIEFESLSSETRATILKLTSAMTPKPYIPKA